jgi:aldehyde:ferredoxin oxidoreductase
MQDISHGYMGSILRVHLGTGRVQKEPLSPDLALHYIGGRGMAGKILYDELKPGTDPLGPENTMVFLCGPLAAGLAQSCSRWIVATKSPQTGGIFRSSAGGPFGAELKLAGYDALIVEGRSDTPVYLYINDDSVELRDARPLCGRLTHETTGDIRRLHGDSKIKVACIGPAGEKLVRFAAIVDGRRTASRGGVGAVMGSKNLKAIAVRGTRRVRAFDEEKLKSIVRAQMETVQNEPRLQGFRRLGTAAAVQFCHEFGLYPVRNFQNSVFPDVNGRLTGARIDEIIAANAYCCRCPIHCGSILNPPEPYAAGGPVEGPEYETLYSFGGMLGNSDLGLVIEANRICDDYGVDTMSAGATIAFAMELYEKGLLRQADLDGLELTWGNQTAILALLKKIVTRSGAGDLLAEGSRESARRIGGGAEKYAMQVKGLEFAGYDPRALKGLALNYATAPLGASHCVGQCPEEIVPGGPVDRFAVEGKGEICKKNQDKVALFETGVVCIFPMQFHLITIPVLAQMLYAATGIEQFSDEAYLVRAGERIWNLERAFNVREGFSRADDRLPERFINEPMPDGAAKGQVVELDALLDQYYRVRGWNPEKGYPTRSRLDELGLSCVADDLEKLGRLG